MRIESTDLASLGNMTQILLFLLLSSVAFFASNFVSVNDALEREKK